MKELNDYLEAKGVSTHLNQKRTLARAFGLLMDNGTEEQQRDLLRALKVGCMAIQGEIDESFIVEFAFDEIPARKFGSLENAELDANAFAKQNHYSRINRVMTICHTEKTIQPK